MNRKGGCACVGQHQSMCPFRNYIVKADFSDLKEKLDELSKQYERAARSRNSKRIPKILKRLEKLWNRHPNLRLLQLIDNAIPGNTYFVEDEELIRKLENFYKNRQ